MADSDEDDVPRLSAETLAALQNFYEEQKELEELESDPSNSKKFQENWQLSQFWYDENTAAALAEECKRICGASGRIACLSTPTLFFKLLDQAPHPVATNAILFEYDARFSVHGDQFVHYDCNNPLNVPQTIEAGSFDLVVADPPFLSEDCLEKFAKTIKFLMKDKLILCTGSVMEPLAVRLLNVRRSSFAPKHEKGLSNNFSCFVNYDSELK